ncbi:MAG TPA: hypothetical protein VF725_02455 [Ktedonobacterales bacterium]
MRRSLRGARARLAVALLLALAWLLAGGAVALAAPALASDPTPVAGTPEIGTPATTPTILPAPTDVTLPADNVAPAGPPIGPFVQSATLTCGAALVALVVTVVSMMLLLRRGYGPFLRALVRGSSGDDEAGSGRAAGGRRGGRRVGRG